MASDFKMYSYDGEKSFTLKKWKIRKGALVLYNSVILSCKYGDSKEEDVKDPLLRYKSNIAGTVLELVAKEGDLIQPGTTLIKVQPCSHPVTMKDLCAECGTDLRHLDKDNFDKLAAATTFSMVHIVPELKVCLEQAEKLGQDDEDRLLKNEKLVLLVDLDQTLIHTTNDFVDEGLPDMHHFKLYGPNSPAYHTKLRPGARKFLEKMSELFELHICTFGARLYAHKIAEILDADSKLFSHRILSRDECFDATSKTGNLKALFPRGDSMVCIIDDREDVWNYAPNVIHVKPFNYFRNTGDINAPPPVSFVSHGRENVKKTVENSKAPSMPEKITSENVQENGSVVQSTVSDFKSHPCLENPNQTNELNLENKAGDVSPNEVKNSVPLPENANKPVNSVTSNEHGNQDKSQSSEKDEEVKTEDIKSDENCDVKYDQFGYCYRRKYDEHGNKTELFEHDPFADPNADDYLLYLEDILRNVHKAYYDHYKEMKLNNKSGIPDLKVIVPKVRKNVLKGVNLVFSSIIPTNCTLETNKYWTLAESLGARVFRELVVDSSENRTTHVVASKFGTAKVNSARRHRGIHIVTLDWLLCCSERWEHTDERLFTLTKESNSDKANEGYPEHSFYDPSGKAYKGVSNKQPSLKRKSRKNHSKSEEEMFSERIFVEAGLSFSQEEIEDMDREVEEACSEESEGESEKQESSNTSSDESLSSGDYPKGWKRPRTECVDLEQNDGAEESSDADTIGSVDEEIVDAVKQEFGSC
ncbi:RNA polymerase II subunit A C-terminal domain phosphatase-like [Uloborus diversus]|uniref:RNA polymerase II subunit A C-terminal domain phosphatase-like n=1 Tax=Uloborus diversus TaxID=327109 RepID=UPI00240A5723|nr:RNA polymerase II subunit A C-terminal domain phosphatase-like [Uloborus diversus]